MLLQKTSHSWLCAYEERDCFACRRPSQFRLYSITMEFSNFYNKPFQRFASKMMLFLVMVTTQLSGNHSKYYQVNYKHTLRNVSKSSEGNRMFLRPSNVSTQPVSHLGNS